jgi:hypothetical protein
VNETEFAHVNPALLTSLERLAAAGIRILPVPQIATHFVLERAGCVVLVERNEEGFGGVGSPGSLSDKGFAALVTRDGRDWFVGRDETRAATPEDAAEARRLYRDLREILG